jgi:hypothetical protein
MKDLDIDGDGYDAGHANSDGYSYGSSGDLDDGCDGFGDGVGGYGNGNGCGYSYGSNSGDGEGCGDESDDYGNPSDA